MTRILCHVLLLIGLFLPLGCGGGNTPVNEGKDMPVPPKKPKDK